jgi:uncharacterized phage infection (PIP) family protein YhgE
LSPLTKALVVLVTIVSVLFVGVLVPFIARTEDQASLRKDAETKLAAANAKALVAETEISAIQERTSQTIAQLETQANQLSARLTDLQTALSKAQDDAQLERSRLAESKAAIARFSAAAKQQADLLTTLTEQLNQTRTDLVAQRTQGIELADRNNQLESQLDGLTRQVRRFAERMTSLQERNAVLENTLAQLPPETRKLLPTGGAAPVVKTPDTAIAGQVTAVQQADSTTLVQVNVGKNDGVSEGMRFMVHRGDQFLGTALIESVDATASAGRMILQDENITPGDAIYAGPY